MASRLREKAGPPEGFDPAQVEVRRSARRRRTVSARRENGRTVVMIPASFTRAQEQEWVAKMVARLDGGRRRRPPSDTDLAARARRLSREYLDGRAEPRSVHWVGNQSTRWGSCTPSEGTIRISHRVRDMPPYVVDYVLLHELAHLLVASHGPRFWALLEGFPQLERARGFLDGVALAKGYDFGDATDEAQPDDDVDELDDDLDELDEPDDELDGSTDEGPRLLF